SIAHALTSKALFFFFYFFFFSSDRDCCCCYCYCYCYCYYCCYGFGNDAGVVPYTYTSVDPLSAAGTALRNL
ncbi:hypothetical protein GLOIN_2v1707582, partial [Rhizophagus irregularis DAOM 181602=DAOM 197198]